MEQDKCVITLLGLLRVAIATAGAESVNTEGVSWQGVYALARKQGVLALAFDGLVRLFEADKEFAKAFPQSLKLQWINATFHIESRYDYAKSVCSELAEKWAEQDISTLCLKGFAFSTYYPVPNHRECGDFDCYLYDDYVKGNEIAKALGAKVDDGWYKHSEIIYRKAMIENHRFIVAVRNGKKTKRLHNLLDSIARNEERKAIAETKIEMPSTMFNALFMNYHTLTHFLSEGVRLRHILDWAMFLEREQANLDWERFYALCEEFDMRAFVDCSTALAVELFGTKITNDRVVAESPYTERVLDSIINDDNAVYSQSVGAWRMRMMLVRNLFASGWKYKAFTKRTIFTTFISLAWGYLTHPEEE
jgi:hypothetical protein